VHCFGCVNELSNLRLDHAGLQTLLPFRDQTTCSPAVVRWRALQVHLCHFGWEYDDDGKSYHRLGILSPTRSSDPILSVPVSDALARYHCSDPTFSFAFLEDFRRVLHNAIQNDSVRVNGSVTIHDFCLVDGPQSARIAFEQYYVTTLSLQDQLSLMQAVMRDYLICSQPFDVATYRVTLRSSGIFALHNKKLNTAPMILNSSLVCRHINSGIVWKLCQFFAEHGFTDDAGPLRHITLSNLVDSAYWTSRIAPPFFREHSTQTDLFELLEEVLSPALGLSLFDCRSATLDLPSAADSDLDDSWDLDDSDSE
jgi:hypothetical protein